ncbi:MAG TPA: hypothetical protein VNC78_03800 [Actinomycetota bacterium]|nr:hypothetical protein [Actinomycetota bacterium]
MSRSEEKPRRSPGRLDTRLRADLEGAAASHPRVAARYHWVLRHRWPLLAVAGILRALSDGVDPIVTQDLYSFSEAGTDLLAGRWSEVYAHPQVQTGPLHLALFGLNRVLSDSLGFPLQAGITVGVTLGLLAAAVYVLRRLCAATGRTPTPGFELFFGLVIVFGGFAYEGATSAHPTEGFIPLLWLLAGVRAREDKAVRAGLLLALASVLKPWGILGLPLLLITSDLRRALKGALVCGVVSATAYAPFLLAAPSGGGSLGFSWSVAHHAPIRLLLDPDTTFTWWMRVAQGAVCGGAGIFVAWRARRDERAVWSVPLAIMAVRLLSDPLDYHYYWLSPGLVGLIAACTVVTFRPTWVRVPLAASFAVTLMPFYVVSGAARAMWIGLLALGVLVVAGFSLRRPPTAG